MVKEHVVLCVAKTEIALEGMHRSVFFSEMHISVFFALKMQRAVISSLLWLGLALSWMLVVVVPGRIKCCAALSYFFKEAIWHVVAVENNQLI